MTKIKKTILGCLLAGLLSIPAMCGAATWVDGMESENSDIDWDRDSVYYCDGETVFVNLKWKIKNIQTTYLQDVYIVRGEVAKVGYVRIYDANGNLKKEGPTNDILPFAGTPMAPMFNNIIAYANKR